MEQERSFDPARRFFVTRVIPGCALACAGLGSVVAAAAGAMAPPAVAGQVAPPATVGPVAGLMGVHKFDQPWNEMVTVRDHFRLQYEEVVKLVRALSGEIGKASLLQMIQTASEERALVVGDSLGQQAPANDFSSFVACFRDPGFQQVMTMQVVEDTPAAFAVQISECLWASTFRDLDAADIGYAYQCHADYSWAQGWNPGIRLTRTQTLMQGHAFCNHRYTWEG